MSTINTTSTIKQQEKLKDDLITRDIQKFQTFMDLVKKRSNGDAFADVALARKMFVNSIHQKLLQTNMYERVNRVRNDATIQHEMQHDFLGLVRRLESTR